MRETMKIRELLLAGGCLYRVLTSENRLRLLCLVRHKHTKDCAVALGRCAAADFHAAFVLLNDLQAHPESQTCAGNTFGGEKWFKNAGNSFTRHAVAFIGYGYKYAFAAGAPVRAFAFAHNDFSAIARGVQRIANQIGKYLADFAVQAVQRFGPSILAYHGDPSRGEPSLIELKYLD